MADEPLKPFVPPSEVLANLHIPYLSISGGTAIQWVLYAVFAFWAIYTLIAVYHWIRYSHAALIATPAIALHLFVSLNLITYALSGTFLFIL